MKQTVRLTSVFSLILATIFFVQCSSNQNGSNSDTHATDSNVISQENHIEAISMEHDSTLDSLFTNRGVTGTVLVGLSPTHYVSNDLVRADKRFCPASTFKIFNSLVGIENQTVESVDEVFKWDGEKRFYDKWNQDHNMRTALKYSCVWFYQELARRSGRDVLQKYLDSLPYGNKTIGEKVDEFWLDGSLEISPKEQAFFIRRLVDYNVPFSKSTVDTVREIMLVDSTDSYSIHAKTGWSVRLDKQVGWFVGYLQKKGEYFPFAVNIDMEGQKDIRHRQDIAYAALKAVSLID